MLFKNTVFEPDNVGCDPGGGPSHPREAAMRYDVIAFCDDELVLIPDLSALEFDTFPTKQSSVDRPRTRSEHHKTRGQSQQQRVNSPMTSVRDHHPQLNEHRQSP
jgi:hypothetical protein